MPRTARSSSALTEHRAQGLQLFLVTRVPGLMVAGNGVATGGGKNGGTCPVLFYLDGFKLTGFDFDALRLEHLAGIEAYSRISAPVQYKPLGDYCKVILLWTKW
jgi:hypothetical protein